MAQFYEYDDLKYDPLPPYPPLPRPKKKRVGCMQFGFFYALGFAGGIGLLLMAAFGWALLFPPPHTNILLLGLDRRANEGVASRTDTNILVGIDSREPGVTMLSIPRDLYVRQLDGSENRINVAHRFAELSVEGSGPQATMAVVEQNFGVDVNKFVRIDFQGFVTIIDAAGGVTIDVPAPFFDAAYPNDNDTGVIYVAFEAGVQHMDGARALQYARIRHGSSDLVRAGRQQQVISAFVAQLLKPTTWPRLPLVYTAVSSSATTNLTPLDLFLLGPTLLRVGPNNFQRVVMEPPMVRNATTSGGASVLMPIWSEVEPLLLAEFGK